MGLDGTIKRRDGNPLGNVAEVQKVLAEIFPGINLGVLPSSLEIIRQAAESGVEFPEVLRKCFESTPARYAGDFEGPEYSAEFILGSSEIVQQIDVVLRGNTVASDSAFDALESRYGWITTHP